MAKQAIYLAYHNGQDGLEKERIVFASTIEQERDNFINANHSKYYKSKDLVIDLEVEKKKAFNKLDGLELLALGMYVPRPPQAMRGSVDIPQGINRHSINEQTAGEMDKDKRSLFDVPHDR